MHYSIPIALTLLKASLTYSAIIARSAPSSSPTAPSPTISPVIPVQPLVTYIPPTTSVPRNVTKIFSYNNGGFENLAFRSNGQLLATIAFHEGLLFYIDPLMIRPGIVLHNFTSLSGTLGITELAPDMFYVAGVVVTANNGSSSSSSPLYNIYSVDMRGFVVLPDGTIVTPPAIKEVGTVAGELNGMTSLDRNDSFILSADSLAGGVWRTFVDSGESELIIKDPSMAGPPNGVQYAGIGINGLRTQNGTLFYCNSGAQTFSKMPLHPDGSSAGNATTITSGIACDDFALDPWGFAYVASPRNALIKLDTRTGAQLVVAGTFNQSTSDIISASSVRFGVGDSDRSSAYITTNGGAYLGAPLGSQGISRVDLGDLAEVFG